MQHEHTPFGPPFSGRFAGPPDSLIGRVVSDRYRIIRKLGEPGLAGLYVAEHLLVNRYVAQLTTAALGAGQTGSGLLFSAPAYVAPEVALAQAVDHRADIYSLGCLLYEMLAGAPPFEGRSVVEVVNKHIQERPLP